MRRDHKEGDPPVKGTCIPRVGYGWDHPCSRDHTTFGRRGRWSVTQGTRDRKEEKGTFNKISVPSFTSSLHAPLSRSKNRVMGRPMDGAVAGWVAVQVPCTKSIVGYYYFGIPLLSFPHCFCFAS